MTENLTRIQYWFDSETPDNTGWYICHFGDAVNLMANSPEDVIGPYDTRQEAHRALQETTDLDRAEDRITRKPYDPVRDPPKQAVDAASPGDTDESI